MYIQNQNNNKKKVNKIIWKNKHYFTLGSSEITTGWTELHSLNFLLHFLILNLFKVTWFWSRSKCLFVF